MAVTYGKYDSSKPIGGRIARGADFTRRGFDEFASGLALIVGITGAALAGDAANNVKDLLVGGDVGAEDADNARRMYNSAYTVKY